jgi:hypothetical protein
MGSGETLGFDVVVELSEDELTRIVQAKQDSPAMGESPPFANVDQSFPVADPKKDPEGRAHMRFSRPRVLLDFGLGEDEAPSSFDRIAFRVQLDGSYLDI